MVVRLRVTIEADGRPSEVKVLTPGPEVFTQRATRCASEESYLAALDDEGTPFVSAAEFGIEFLP